MSQSINYYIQLPDKLSTVIDSMSKDELIEKATATLTWYSAANGKREYSRFYYGSNSTEVLTKNLPTIAYGLLAKANCMK